MNKLMNVESHIDPKIEALTDVPMPPHLHGKIMRRVFLAGYGKYLIFSTSILLLNLSVLVLDLYRALSTASAEKALQGLKETFAVTPVYFASVASTLYSILPLQSIIATAFTVALSAYIAVVFVRIYRNPQGVRLLKM